MNSACTCMGIKVRNPRFLASLKLLHDHLISDSLRLIELGCGKADLLVALANALTAKEIYDVDIDEEALAEAQNRGVKVVKADLNIACLPFKDEFFDVVIMEEVIEHLINPDNAIQEAYRILKSEGYFLISTPNLAWWVNRLALLLGFQPYWTECSTRYNIGKFGRKNYETLSGHLRLYTLRALKEILKLYGFRILEYKGVTYGNIPPILKEIDMLLSKRTSLAQIIVLLAMK
ncbi:MAG: class I SAM-dependent methyltransferase [Nitrososphaeria archaeon]